MGSIYGDERNCGMLFKAERLPIPVDILAEI